MDAHRRGGHHGAIRSLAGIGSTRSQRDGDRLCVRESNLHGLGSIYLDSLYTARREYRTTLSALMTSDTLQVDQKDLGVSGGLSGVARNGGGVVALTVCTTILPNVQASSMKKLVPVVQRYQ